MKRLNTIILFMLPGLFVFIQSPKPSEYREVMRKSVGEVIANHKVERQDSIPPTIAISTGVYNDLQNFSNVNCEVVDATHSYITNFSKPENDQDPVTEAYTDDQLNNASELDTLTTKVKDYDGNLYSTVKIGNQVWMAKNLKTTHYSNGDAIPDGTGVGNISGETEPKYWFACNDDLKNVFDYGRLYTWYTITDSRNVCPDGWHVSSDTEWTTLQTYLGGSSDAGGKMKETGTAHWTSPNTGATNESGFSALPSSYRRRNGEFYGIGEFGNWWSSTEFTASLAWSWALYHNGVFIARHDSDKKYGFAVRCIKD